MCEALGIIPMHMHVQSMDQQCDLGTKAAKLYSCCAETASNSTELQMQQHAMQLQPRIKS